MDVIIEEPPVTATGAPAAKYVVVDITDKCPAKPLKAELAYRRCGRKGDYWVRFQAYTRETSLKRGHDTEQALCYRDKRGKPRRVTKVAGWAERWGLTVKQLEELILNLDPLKPAKSIVGAHQLSIGGPGGNHPYPLLGGDERL
jgi:hypothetical protein